MLWIRMKNRLTCTTKCHWMESTKKVFTWLKQSSLFINGIISFDWFYCKTFSQCDKYGCFSFSKSEYMWSFRMNCNRSLADVLIKRFLYKKKIKSLLTGLSNHQTNNSNRCWLPPLSHKIVPIIFHQLNQLQSDKRCFTFWFYLFFFFTVRTDIVMPHGMTSRCGIQFLLGLFE